MTVMELSTNNNNILIEEEKKSRDWGEIGKRAAGSATLAVAGTGLGHLIDKKRLNSKCGHLEDDPDAYSQCAVEHNKKLSSHLGKLIGGVTGGVGGYFITKHRGDIIDKTKKLFSKDKGKETAAPHFNMTNAEAMDAMMGKK